MAHNFMFQDKAAERFSSKLPCFGRNCNRQVEEVEKVPVQSLVFCGLKHLLRTVTFLGPCVNIR
jgi:hypothetical protein